MSVRQSSKLNKAALMHGCYDEAMDTAFNALGFLFFFVFIGEK